MKRITLMTMGGRRLTVALDHWGAGVDAGFRRWLREPDGWRCLETGEVAYEMSLWSRMFSSASRTKHSR